MTNELTGGRLKQLLLPTQLAHSAMCITYIPAHFLCKRHTLLWLLCQLCKWNQQQSAGDPAAISDLHRSKIGALSKPLVLGVLPQRRTYKAQCPAPQRPNR